MNFKIFLLVTTFLTFSCSMSNNINLQQYEEAYILFGTGGGFSGIENRYCLIENGNIYQMQNMDKNGILLGTIDKNTAQQLISSTNRISDQIPEINEPGNTYQFLEFQKNDDKKTYIWNHAPDHYQEIKILHSILIKYQSELSTSKM